MSDNTPHMDPDIEIGADEASLAGILAARVGSAAAAAVAARGRFSIAIPGGSVVALLAQGLALPPCAAGKPNLASSDARSLGGRTGAQKIPGGTRRGLHPPVAEN